MCVCVRGGGVGGCLNQVYSRETSDLSPDIKTANEKTAKWAATKKMSTMLEEENR